MKRVLVTGSTGFVGRHVVRALASDAELLLPVRRKPVLDGELLMEALDPDLDWKPVLSGCHSVVHIAALAHRPISSSDEDVLYRKNVLAVVNLARQALTAGVQRFVFISSIGVNGEKTSGVAFSELDPAKPHNAYAASKYQAEEALRELVKGEAMELVILRPPLVYGADAPGNFGRLLALVKRLPFNPFSRVSNRRSYVSVRNLAEQIRVLAISEESFPELMLVSDITLSTAELVDLIAESQAKTWPSIPLPMAFFRLCSKLPVVSKPLAQLIGNLEVDSSLAKSRITCDQHFSFLESMNRFSEE